MRVAEAIERTIEVPGKVLMRCMGALLGFELHVSLAESFFRRCWLLLGIFIHLKNSSNDFTFDTPSLTFVIVLKESSST